MKKHLISYDLLKPGKDYEPLYQRLRQLGALKVLYSEWLLRSTATAVQVRDDLKRFIDGNDRLLVTVLTGEAAWTSLISSDETFKSNVA